MAYHGGPSGTGSLQPRKVRKVKVRRSPRPSIARAVNTAVSTATRTSTRTARPVTRPAARQDRNPAQVNRQRATRKAGAPARRKLRVKRQHRDADAAARAVARTAALLADPHPLHNVFEAPIARVRISRRDANTKLKRAAAALPAEHRLPQFPLKSEYAPHERAAIDKRFRQALNAMPSLPGESGGDKVDRIYGESDPSTRRQLKRVWGGVLHQQKRAEDAAFSRQAIRAYARAARPRPLTPTEAFEATPRLKSMKRLKKVKPVRPPSEHDLALMRRQLDPNLYDELKPGEKKDIGDKLGGGLSNVGAVLTGGIHPVKGMALTDAAKGVGRLWAPAAKDLVNLPAETVTSLYMTGDALASAAGGDTKKLKELAHQFKEHDPIALALQGRFHDAGQAVAAHPLNAVLEVAGSKAVVGRGAGAVARHTPSKKVRAYASTDRAPLELYGNAAGGPTIARSYSKDLITKRAQVRSERRKVKKGENPNLVSTRHVPVIGSRQVREINKRVDDEVAINEGLRRRGRTEATKATVRVLSPTSRKRAAGRKVASKLPGKVRVRIIHEGAPTRKHATAVPLIVAKIVRKPSTVAADLRRYRDLITSHPAAELFHGQVKQRDAMVEQIDALLADKEFLADPSPAFKAAKTFTRDEHARTADLQRVGLLSQDEAHAALIPYAIAHMNAHPAQGAIETASFRHFRAARDGEAAAMRDLRATGRAVQTARRREARARGRAEVYTAHADRRKVRSDPEFRAAAVARSRADKKVRAARVAVEDAGRNPKLYTAVQLGTKLQTLQSAERAAAAAKAAFKSTEKRVSAKLAPPGRPPRAAHQKARDELAAAEATHARAVADAEVARKARVQANVPKGERKAVPFLLRPLDRAEQAAELKAANSEFFNHVRKAANLKAKGASQRSIDQALARAHKAEIRFKAAQRGEGHVPLSAAEVKAHMATEGVDEPGFFSQRPNATGPGNFYIPAVQGRVERVALNSQRRSGAATQAGAFDASPKVLIAQAARDQGLVDAAKGFDRLINVFALHKPHTTGDVVTGKGFWRSWDDAHRAGEELADTNGGIELAPVNVGRLQAVHDLLDAAVPEDQALASLSDRVRQAFERDEGGNGRYVLIPKTVRDRLLQHVESRGSLEKQLQNLSRVFKTTVLATSLKWLTGNVIDISMRLAAEGATPLDLLRGAHVMRQLKRVNPEAARIMQERGLGGAWFAHVDKAATFHEPSMLAKAPPISQLRGVWNGFTKAVFGANTMLEKGAQHAVLGKVARQSALRDLSSLGSFFRVGEKGLEQFAHGLEGTAEQVAAARHIEQVLGRWSKHSPEGRRFLIQYAPFGQWLRVAMKFVYVTLPRHHPIKTGILAALNTMTEEERKQLGLDLAAPDDKRLAPYQQGGIPTGDGDDFRVIRFQSYTSFGLMGDPGSLGDFILPQYRSIDEALKGFDWKGDKLVNADGSPPTLGQRVWIAANVAAEGFVPLLSIGRRLREQGGNPTAESTIFSPSVKPDSKGNAVDEIFNPFRPLTPRLEATDRFGNLIQPKGKGSGEFDFSTAEPADSSADSFDFSTAQPAGETKAAVGRYGTGTLVRMGAGEAARTASGAARRPIKVRAKRRKVRVR